MKRIIKVDGTGYSLGRILLIALYYEYMKKKKKNKHIILMNY